jgi:hypothetical protein
MQSKPRSGCAIVAILRLQLQATSARALHGAGGIRRTSGFPRALAAARAALVRSEIASRPCSATAARMWMVSLLACGLITSLRSSRSAAIPGA